MTVRSWTYKPRNDEQVEVVVELVRWPRWRKKTNEAIVLKFYPSQHSDDAICSCEQSIFGTVLIWMSQQYKIKALKL